MLYTMYLGLEGVLLEYLSVGGYFRVSTQRTQDATHIGGFKNVSVSVEATAKVKLF